MCYIDIFIIILKRKGRAFSTLCISKQTLAWVTEGQLHERLYANAARFVQLAIAKPGVRKKGAEIEIQKFRKER